MDSNYSFEVGKYYKYRNDRIYLCSDVDKYYITFSHELRDDILLQLPYEYSYSQTNSDSYYWKEYLVEKISYDNEKLNQIIHAI